MVIANVTRGFGISLGLGNEINLWAGVSLNFDCTVGIVGALVGVIAGIIIIGIAGLIIRAGIFASGIVVIVLITAGTIIIVVMIVVVVVIVVVG